ncbi:hypothetical protein ABZ990_09900 [Streptomyces sp. NPDC046203]|uniref:hypothetical protein n=1 Tax=Streptomyces sp. NPDC046203 TaxID=3154602 RepID=UPI0033F526B2
MDAIPVLGWGDSSHFDHTRDRPCCLCGRPTPLRSHAGEPVHKVCAEDWNHAHPDAPRLYTPPDKRDPDRPQHCVGTVRFHNDGPNTPILSRRTRTATPQPLNPDDGEDFLFAA